MDESGDVTVGACVRAVLDEQGRAQKWLADRVGIAPMDLSRRLAGKKGFTVAELIVIARELGVPLADLLPAQVRGNVGQLPVSWALVLAQGLGVRGVAGKLERLGREGEQGEK